MLENNNQDVEKDIEVEELITDEKYTDEELIEYKINIKSQYKNGISWFYWIAALSIINTIVYFVGLSWSFIIGLGITQVIDTIAYEIQGTGRIIALIIDILAAGIFVLFGFLARKGYNWIFILGMVIYALDGLIFIYFRDWLSIGFHVFVLYEMYKGLRANKILKQMETEKSLDE